MIEKKTDSKKRKKSRFFSCKFKIYAFLCVRLVILIIASDFYYKVLLLYE